MYVRLLHFRQNVRSVKCPAANYLAAFYPEAVVPLVSHKKNYLEDVRGIFAVTSVLLRFCFASICILPILEYCSLVQWSASNCHLHLLERQVRAVAMLYPDQNVTPVNHRRSIVGLYFILEKFIVTRNATLYEW